MIDPSRSFSFRFFAAVFCVFVLGVLPARSAEPQLDLTRLTSPVLSLFPAGPEVSNDKVCCRDPAVYYEGDRFYFFFTLIEIGPNGEPFSFVATTVSSDLIHFEPVRKLTPRDLALNFGSPGNVVRDGNSYCLCVQTYCQDNGEKYGNANSRIWTMRSRNLRDWDKPELLRVKGDNVPVGKMGRMIDPYLVRDRFDPGRWWCFFKQNGVSISSSRDMKHWTFHHSVSCGENVCVLYDEQKKRYRLWNSPSNGIGEMYSTDLIHWTPVDRLITLGQSEWDWAKGRLTAAVVLDLRKNPRVRKALMFFHASRLPEAELFPQGTSLGIAWSDDLEHWTWPGMK